MRRLLDRSEAPPQDADGDSFRYYHPETGHKSAAVDYQTWQERIYLHRKAMELPIMSDTMAQAEDQLCGTLPPDRCQYETGDLPPVNINVGFNDVVNWIKAIGSRFLNQEPFVPQAEAERRAAICVSCPLNVNLDSGCGAGCRKLVEHLTPGMAAKRTLFDLKLRSCAVCHCFNKVQVWFPLSILEENDTPERQAQYPPTFCWKSHRSPTYQQT